MLIDFNSEIVNSVFELPGGWTPPTVFSTPPNTLSYYVLGGQLYAIYTVSQKKKHLKLFFSQLCHKFTKFDSFWHEDGQDDKIMQWALIFHLT